MLLTMDVGNSNIKFGVFNQSKLIDSFRVSTDNKKTGDEYGAIIHSLLSKKGVTFADIDGVIMSSVSPTMNYTLEHMCKFYFGVTPLIVEPGVKTGINIRYDNPKELGADRIVNAVAASINYGGPCIVVDFGTATTFSVLNGNNEFIGGAICPGVKTAVDALVSNASKLPRIELEKPSKVIGKNTIHNMQSGIIYGFIGLVENITRLMKKELNCNEALVIATGGMSEMMANSDRKVIDIIDRDLTLKGLRLIYEMNKD